jgi:hypothetical protein
MMTRTIIAVAVCLGTAASALAEIKRQHGNPPGESAYETRNSYINTDADQNVRADNQQGWPTHR